MNVLIACEESGRVTHEFYERECNVFSCDLVPTSGEHPDRHIIHDVSEIIDTPVEFTTETGQTYFILQWDLIIAHPPCTFLTISGNAWYDVKKYGDKAIKRLRNREDAIKFFMMFANNKCPHICIENPVGIMSTIYRPPNQYIEPWQYRLNDTEKYAKKTGLWLKKLPPLIPKYRGKPVLPGRIMGSKWYNEWHIITRNLSDEERRKARSKTPYGIARAMAERWCRIEK